MFANLIDSLPAPKELEIALPSLLAVVTASVVLAVSMMRRNNGDARIYSLLVGLGGCILTFLALLQLVGRSGGAFHGELRVDDFGLWTGMLATVATLLVMLGTLEPLHRYGAGWGEALSLMMLTLSGVILVCMAGGLLALFLGIEILSISAYGLTALTRFRAKSVEGALRYFILGAVASAFLLMGIAFAYGATGTTSITALLPVAGSNSPYLSLLAFGFLLTGLTFKIGAVPFHTWVPDAYEGAPTPISGFMASAVKVAAFAALLRILYTPLATQHLGSLHTVLGAIAALTMVLGNLVALVQTNLKRMLAYSSVAHSGYMLLGIISPGSGGPGAVLFYLAVYVPTVIGAFMILVYAGRENEDLEHIDSIRGLARKHPLLALCMTLFMLSLIGVPVTGGFIAKLAIFSAAIRDGYTVLAILGIVMSIVSVAYYLNVIRVMYIPPADHAWYDESARYGMKLLLVASVVFILVLGLLPGGVIEGARNAAQPLVEQVMAK